MSSDLTSQLTRIGLRATAEHLDDFIARATTRRLAPRALLEQIAEAEMADRATRNLQRLLKQARIGRFKPISDFDWDWPKKTSRVDRARFDSRLHLRGAQSHSARRQWTG